MSSGPRAGLGAGSLVLACYAALSVKLSAALPQKGPGQVLERVPEQVPEQSPSNSGSGVGLDVGKKPSPGLVENFAFFLSAH